MKELVYNRHLLPAVERYAAREGFVDGGYRATFEQHADRVLRLANALRNELGVKPGDRVAIMALNSHEYVELYHACFLGAAVINPLNLRLAGPELDYIVRDSGAEVVFVDAMFAEHLAKGLSESGESPIRSTVLIGEGDVDHDVAFEDLIAAGEPTAPDEPEEEDPVVLMYTGGTTGQPKGVLVDQRAEMLNAYHIVVGLGGLRRNEVNLLQTPLFHAATIGGMLAMPITGGKTVTIPGFEPGAVMSTIEDEGVTMTVMVPTMIGLTMMHPEYSPARLGTLGQLVYGASPMPAAIMDHLLSELPEVELLQGYGMTESSSVLTFLMPEDHVPNGEKLRSAGQPLLGVELSIQDPAGNVLPAGETGEVCARAGNLMREYWKQPEATAEAFRGGWYHTGDAGYLDSDGYLFLVDRVKDMIVTGGENVYSIEVENAISTHPDVAQVAVIGVPDDTWGERVHAVVVPAGDAELTEEDVVAHARAKIAGYKVPKSVEFRTDPLPLSGAMKVLKRDLRAPYWEGQDRAVN